MANSSVPRPGHSTNNSVPAFRSELPRAEALLPYLRRIDDARQYSNFGELNLALLRRLAAEFQVPPEHVVPTSSGTAALVAGILAVAGRASADRPICILPSYTFSATAAAAELCGYTVHLADVDRDSWTLNPVQIRSSPLLERVGLVLPVCPYGTAVDQSAWSEFSGTTGIPVVIDAAASFESLVRDPSTIGSIPVALSFHASKSYSTGEGGMVVCTNTDVIRSVARATNFGMLGERSCRAPGFNGKMSEYHSAVGLAELDGWEVKQQALRSVAERYREAFSKHSLRDRIVAAPLLASCYVLFEAVSSREAEAVRASLTQEKIDHRLWYGLGLHREPYFASASQDDLQVTDAIAETLIGLPTAPDLPVEVIGRVAATIASAV